MPLVQRAAPFQVTAEDEIGVQMRRRGFDPADVRWVVLTHLHQDHDGGLRSFPNAEIVVARGEWAAGRGLGGRMRGYFNWRWAGLQPRLIDFADGGYFSFGASERLAAGVRLVPTPGHSAGHLSVVVEDGARAVFLAGDSAYSQDLLLRDTVDGVGPDPAAQRDTHRRILSFAAQVPTIYLPSHDPDSENRLALGETLPGGVGSPVFA
jgi:glyoxylase-like metal-dependent hydrolase (beta-lactamase superfamily II)